MLYQAYQFQDDFIAPLRHARASTQSAAADGFLDLGRKLPGGRCSAALEMVSRFELTHARPDFGIAHGEGRQPRRCR